MVSEKEERQAQALTKLSPREFELLSGGAEKPSPEDVATAERLAALSEEDYQWLLAHVSLSLEALRRTD